MIWLKRLLWLGLVLAVLTFANYHWVQYRTASALHTQLEQLSTTKVGLVLGTSKRLTSGHLNLYYRYRLEAALALYESGKVSHLLLSGDNSRKDYNEPEQMKMDLVAAGVPAEKIYLDYAGFRTLDSVVRAEKIFGLTEFICVTQPFHAARTVYIAQRKGLNVTAFTAREVPAAYGFKVILREYLARMKMQLDLLLDVQPKFLGDPIEIK